MRRGAAENRTRIGVDAAENELRRPPPMSSGGLQPIRAQVWRMTSYCKVQIPTTQTLAQSAGTTDLIESPAARREPGGPSRADTAYCF